jgi:hypothetical protein
MIFPVSDLARSILRSNDSIDGGSHRTIRLKDVQARIGIVYLLPCLLIQACATPSFDQRVAHADSIEISPAGETFQRRLWPQIGDSLANLMRQCFPTGKTRDTDSFVLVADASRGGKLRDVEVRPSTPMTRCVVDKFSSLTIPAIPQDFDEATMPLVFKMKITD